MLKLILSYSRVLLPLMLGICIGIALSFMVLPLLEEGRCEGQGIVRAKIKRGAESLSWYMQGVNFESFRNEEFRVKQETSLPKEVATNYKQIRQKYMKAEVDMKSILMISYHTTSNQLQGRALALNKTVSKSSSLVDLRFFIGSRPSSIHHDLPLISFNLQDSKTLSLLMVKYFANQQKAYPGYKYYAILPDSTYVKAESLKTVLLHVRDSDYMGFSRTSEDSTTCDLSVGLILSYKAVSDIGENIRQCDQMFNGQIEPYQSLDKCITTILGRECTSFPTSLPSRMTHITASPESSSVLSSNTLLPSDKTYETNLAVSNIQTVNEIYNFRRKETMLELQRNKDKIQDIRSQISNLYQLDGNSENNPWDPFVPKPYHTTNRYDILRWTLIEDNQTFLAYDYEVGKPLKVHDQMDLQNMMNDVVEFLNEESDQYTLVKLQHAYRKIDPTRGMDYLMTLQLHDTYSNQKVTKTLEVVKPISGLQLIREPFSTSSIPVYILIPFIGDDVGRLDEVIKSFNNVFMRDPSAYLQVVIGISEDNSQSHSPSTLKYHIQRMVANLGSLGKIDGIIPTTSLSTIPELLDYAIRNLPENVIAFTSSLSTQLGIDLLTHIRQNTIKGRQVYAPIGFWEYTPELIYESKRRPTRVEVSRNIGHFGELWYDHISFYTDDYHSNYASQANISDVYDTLTRTSKLAVMRSVEPELLISNEPTQCPAKSARDQNKCHQQTLDNVGSAPLLARKLLQEGKIEGMSYY